MSYARLKRRLDSGAIVILDGATGTELQKRGVPMDPAAWCGPATLENEALLVEIHGDYIRAGAEVITANTFASSRLMLAAAGYADRVEEINRRAVEAALRARDIAAGRNVVVAGSLSHMIPVTAGTDRVDPARIPSRAEISEAFGELAEILRASGVDCIILEMMYHPERTRLALDAALSTGLPVWFGISARRTPDGRVVSFHDPDDLPIDDVVQLLPGSGVDVAGCMHTGAELVGDVLAVIAHRFSGPLMAYPDSGYFEMPDWRFVDVIPPQRLQDFYADWIRAGAQVIGGCCGLTIEHTAAAVRAREQAESIP